MKKRKGPALPDWVSTQFDAQAEWNLEHCEELRALSREYRAERFFFVAWVALLVFILSRRISALESGYE